MRNKMVVVIGILCLVLVGIFFTNKDIFHVEKPGMTEEEELELAYQWAYDNKITSQATIEMANLNSYVTRWQLAKMMSSFSANILNKEPDTWVNCEFDDVGDSDPYVKLGIIQACQFWLMWQNVKKFRPNDTVTLWEFWVILTRSIWWDDFQWGEPYYKKSLEALNKLWIINDISAPLVDQKRGWIMVMLMRSADIAKNRKLVDDLLYKKYFVQDRVLSDWNVMPVIWLSTLGLDNEKAENFVYEALKIWYRLIDTSREYGNEEWVWRAIRRAIDEWIVKRDEIFVASKVIPSNYSDPNNEVDVSLKNLWLEYLDLMLIHKPWANDNWLYHAFEKAVKEWKVHSLWISNYYTWRAFESINSIANIKPVILQNENHIFYQNTELKRYIDKYWTVLESLYPLGGDWHTEEMLSQNTIKKLAERHNKTPAQIILRWEIQNGNIAVPWAVSLEQIKENFNIFDFELTNQEMKLIHMINKNERNVKL